MSGAGRQGHGRPGHHRYWQFGALTAAVDCFRAWLGRDRDRRIDVRWDENGAERSVTLTGEAVDTETVREIARAALSRGAGPA